MTDRDTLRMRFRIANPVPDPDTIDTDELDRILMAIESDWDQQRGLVPPSNVPDRSRRSRFVPALVFGAAALLLLLAVGLPMLLLGGGEDLPPVEESTTVPKATVTTIPVTTVTTEPTTTTSETAPVGLAPAMIWDRLPHREIFDDASISSIVVGGPGLVAGGWAGDMWGEGSGHALVFVSADGDEWERIDLAPTVGNSSGITHLATGPESTLVAFGCDAVTQPLWVSPDGLEWERIETDIFGPGCRVGVQSVVAGGPGFVAVGNTRTGDAAVWLSEDGYEWIAVEDEDLLAGDADELNLSMDDVVVGGPGLVAVGGSGNADLGLDNTGDFEGLAIWVSEDGSDWERLPNLDDGWVSSVWNDPSGDRIFLFGEGMWVSVDGYEWIQHEAGEPDPFGWGSLAWDGDRVVAGGGDGWTVMLSVSDNRGTTWSSINTDGPTFDGYAPFISDLILFGDSFVAVGEAGDYNQGIAAIWIGAWDE